jgi:hypothetical protein
VTGEWDGRVLEIWDDGDTFTASLQRDGAPELIADFSMTACGITVEAGDLLIITPQQVTKRDLGVWTDDELAGISRRARALIRALRRDFG